MPENFGQQLADGVIAFMIYWYVYSWKTMTLWMMLIHVLPIITMFWKPRRRHRFS